MIGNEDWEELERETKSSARMFAYAISAVLIIGISGLILWFIF